MAAQTRSIRLFVSSTFDDMQAERDILHRDVFPEIRRISREIGFDFQPIDLRWGVSEEAGRQNRAMRICFREIARCKEGGLKPNFLVLLGERYGSRPLPEIIPADLFLMLRTALLKTNPRAARFLEHYRLDENECPPAFFLQPRTSELASYEVWKERVEGPLVTALEGVCARIFADGLLAPKDQKRIRELAIG